MAHKRQKHTPKPTKKRLRYRTILHTDREIPAWVDEAIKKAIHPDPYKRYEEISEFTFNLRQPNKAFLNKTSPPLNGAQSSGFLARNFIGTECHYCDFINPNQSRIATLFRT